MENKDRPIGLITYHSAYNFGSVLQTYGTVRTIEKLGWSVDTIDYRTPSQTFWYQTDFSRKKGLCSMIDNFGFQFIKTARKERAKKYEDFIARFLKPTDKRYTSYKQLHDTDFDYDVLVSGSDQVWNIGCGEFRFEPYDAILPYFLQFGNPKKRVAYASSFGGQTLRNIRKYKDLLCQYDVLSTREPIIRKYIEKATGLNVELVCDPTWLLDKEEWLSLHGVYHPDEKSPYVFVYALYWNFRALNMWLPKIKEFAERNGMNVYCVSPLNYYNDKEIFMLQDAGPLDILSYLAKAALVITNTFHGTIFSMNLEVPFYSCCVQPGSRQGQMLAMCGLEDRIINNPSELLEDNDFGCDFTESTNVIKKLRNCSINYLRNSLCI
ncbi:polysaccharide pyruvyl transferase family protein [uncultured Duncaniella sp.]|uniref:polysaccharide pyruvyl transferase family protein n=1 Tax=uncultured Duncaniella sp. TaxID=2768039 RepID=UPI0025AA2025|nr:polysaccharide pyruvyl transferase family protein [uncultured Duncaniella sp.]